MSKFQRPDNFYEAKLVKNNIDKYQKDRDAIPRIPINAAKIDADFNCVYDAVEEIWQLNLNNKYENLPKTLESLDYSIKKNAQDILSVSVTGLLPPTKANVAYVSNDGISVTTDKIGAEIIKDNAINSKHLSSDCVGEYNLSANCITNNKLANFVVTNEKIAQSLLNNFTLTNNIEFQDQIPIADNSDANKNAKITFASFFETIKRLLGTAATYNVGTNADNIVKLDSNGKLPVLDGSNLLGVAPRNMQAYEGRAVATIYQAENDGFIMGYIKATTPLIQNGAASLNLAVGNSSSSLTDVAIASISVTPNTQYANFANSFCVPIRKGSFYRVNLFQFQTNLVAEMRLLFMPFK